MRRCRSSRRRPQSGSVSSSRSITSSAGTTPSSAAPTDESLRWEIGSAVLFRWLEAQAFLDGRSCRVSAYFHHEDPPHRLAGGEPQHRRVVFGHRRRDVVLPQVVQGQLALPQGQPCNLDDVIWPRLPWRDLLEKPRTDAHRQTAFYRCPRGNREPPAAAASWLATRSWSCSIKPTV